MKKHLLSAALGAALLAPSANAETIEELTPQDRTNWSVLGCSMANDGSDGSLDKIIDGNATTYWHSDWTNDVPTSLENNPHFFIIDRGEGTDDTTFDGFGFLNGVGRQNGNVKEYRLYTTNDITNIQVCDATSTIEHSYNADAHTSIVSFIADLTPVIDSEFPESIKTESGALQQVKFDNQQTGRYVIFVIDSSWNQTTSQHAVCAEFYLYDLTQYDADVIRQEAISRIEAFEPFAGAEALTAAIAAINEATTLDAINTIAEGIITTADYQIVSIKNLRRENVGQAAYLTATSGMKANTANEVTEQSKWQLRRVDSSDYFKIKNLGNGYFISAANVDNVTSLEAYALKVRLVKSGNTTYPGIAMQFENSDNGLNIDTNANDLTSWDKNDDGSTWAFSFVSVPVSQITDGGWYTIRCNRSTKTTGTGCGLLGVLSADLAGNDPVAANRAAGYGSYWQVVSDNANGWKLKNLLTEDKQMGKTDGDNTPKMLTEGTTFYLRDVAEWNNPTPTANGIAISTEATGTTSSTCMDMNASNGSLTINGWYPYNEGVAFDNYGTVYYFEPANDAIVEQARQDYYTYASTKQSVHNNSIDASLGIFAHIPALWNGVDTDSFNNAKENAEAITSIATANGVLTGTITITTPQDKLDALSSAFAASDAMLTDKYFALRSCNPTSQHMATPATGTNATQHETGTDTPASALCTVWQLVGNGNGTYKLKSYATGTFLGQQSARITPIPMADEGADFTLLFHESCTENTFSFLMPNANEAAHSLVFNDQANNRLTIWSQVSSNNKGAQWSLELIETTGNDDIAVEIDNNAIKFSATGLTKTEGLTDNHAIGVTAATRAAAATILPSTVTVDEGTASATLPDGLDEGEYTANIPLGFFTVDNKLSAPMTVSFTVKDGTATSIREIERTANAADIIYDLQGRRVGKTTRGIFIVNGKKVLVK